MTRFPIQGLWHVQICRVTVMICGDAEQGAVSFLTGVWLAGFGTLRTLGDLLTPEYLLLF